MLNSLQMVRRWRRHPPEIASEPGVSLFVEKVGKQINFIIKCNGHKTDTIHTEKTRNFRLKNDRKFFLSRIVLRNVTKCVSRN